MVVSTRAIKAAVNELKSALARRNTLNLKVNQEYDFINAAKNEVLGKYQAVFSPDRISELTAEEFKDFLLFRNNKHWNSLPRLGGLITADMMTLRSALGLLLDESKNIALRLNSLVPRNQPNLVPGLHKAVLTPLLLIMFPDKYGVWNNISEGAMKSLNIWPEFDRKLPFGDKYIKVNDVLRTVADKLGIDLWTLDSAWWWYLGYLDEQSTVSSGTPNTTSFGLERHLHDFIRDNWNTITFLKDWEIFSEDGDMEKGYEYPTDIGRIDLLAKHKTKPLFMVIELKRDQGSDDTLGQIQRYMGWVKKKLASTYDDVEGIIIARGKDDKLTYALEATRNIRFVRYEVDFRLKET